MVSPKRLSASFGRTKEIDDTHGIRPETHATLRPLLPRGNDASDANERAVTDDDASPNGFALGVGKLRLLLGRFENERDGTFLRLLPRSVNVLLTSEVLVDGRLYFLLETLRVVLVSSRFGVVLVVSARPPYQDMTDTDRTRS